jgi:hypothetical protein
MYALIKNQQLIGIFTSKKKMKEICEAIITDDYIDSGTYGWYHFRYIKIKPNELNKALFSLFTMHQEYFVHEIENDPKTGKILSI